MGAKSASPASSQILSEIGLVDLPDEWTVVRLEDLLSNDRGISVGVMYPGDHAPDGIPLIKAGDISGSRINPNPEFRITPEKHFEYRRTELAGGELLISLVGDVGRCALVPPTMAGWNAARAIAVLRFQSQAYAGFVRACLMSPPFQHLMRAWSTTTVQATLNLKEVRQIPLPWPPAEEQRAIAHILGTLDDKIELNRRRNQTLEAMARALFKDWFVDFGPVRLPAGRQAPRPEPKPGLPPGQAGKFFVYAIECENGSVYIGHTEDVQRRYEEHVAGRGAEWTKRHPPRRIAYWEEQPSKSAAIAREKKLKSGSGREWLKAEIAHRDLLGKANPYPPRIRNLFPDRLDDEGKPEGWEMQPLSELLTIIGGGTPKTSVEEYWGGDIPWFSVVDTPSASDVFVVATEKDITSQGLAGSSARLIAKGTTIISARGTGGNLAIAGREMTFNQSCYGLRGTGSAGDYFVYLTAQQMVDQLKSMAHGSVFSTITRQTFEAIPRPVPPPTVLAAFEELVTGWFDAILSNVEESRTLAQLRDTLLPKLISGELRIADAERFMETHP